MQTNDYLAIFVVLVLGIQTYFLTRRIKMLESRLMAQNSQQYIDYAMTQLSQDKVMAIKAIRQQFPELSLVQSVKIYDMAMQSRAN